MPRTDRRVFTGLLILSALAVGMVQADDFPVNSTVAGTQRRPAIAAEHNGDFVVAWEDATIGINDIFVQRFRSDGTAIAGELRVNSSTAGTQRPPEVAMDADGDFVVTWADLDGLDGSGYGIFAQRYASSGSPRGGELQVNTYTTGYQDAHSVAMEDNGDFVVVWSDIVGEGTSRDDGAGGSATFGQRFASSGTRIGGEFQVNTYITGYNGYWTSIGMDADGDFVVAWTDFGCCWSDGQDGDGFGVFARRFASNGTGIGSEFQVNTYTPGYQGFYLDVAMHAAGDFVVAWSSNPQDGSFYGIYAQRFSAAGSPAAGEFRVNTYTPGEQSPVAASFADEGSLVFVWGSGGNQDGSGEGVYAKRFSSDGLVIEGEFRISDYTTGPQRRPVVAMDSEGNFVVAWGGEGAGDDVGIFADTVSKPVAVDRFESGDFSGWSAHVP